MVRLKQRYLLLNILYPTPTRASNLTTQPSTSTSTTLSSTLTPTLTPPPPSFLQFHAPTPQHLSPQLFLSSLRTQISQLFGDHGLGASQSSLKIIYFSHATSTVILRVPRGAFRLVWAALSFMQGIPAAAAYGAREARGREIACVVRVVRVSGTIRKVEEELVRRGRREIVRAKMGGRGGGGGGGHEVVERGVEDGDVGVDDEDESE